MSLSSADENGNLLQVVEGTTNELAELASVAPIPSDANLVVGYTPPNPLPTYTASQIVQALRTSWLGPVNAANDYPQDTRTFTWATNLPITYRLVTTQTVITNTNGTATTADDSTTTRDNMSVQEQARIAEEDAESSADDEPSITMVSLGAIIHGVLSLKTLVQRQFARIWSRRDKARSATRPSTRVSPAAAARRLTSP